MHSRESSGSIRERDREEADNGVVGDDLVASDVVDDQERHVCVRYVQLIVISIGEQSILPGWRRS